MRGQRRVRLWTINVALALLTAFVYGAVAYEPHTYRATWTSEGTNQVETWHLGEGAEAVFAVEVPARNLTAVALSLTWSDDVAPADHFTFRVRGPIGPGGEDATRTISGDHPPLRIDLSFLDMPAPRVIQAGDEADAWAQLPPRHAPWEGNAPFTVRAHLTHVGTGSDDPFGLTGAPDQGNEIQMSLAYTQFVASLAHTG